MGSRFLSGLFLKVAWGLVADPPSSFEVPDVATWWLVTGGVLVALLAWAGRRRGAGLIVVAVGLVGAVVTGWSDLALGPSAVPLPVFSVEAFMAAATALRAAAGSAHLRELLPGACGRGPGVLRARGCSSSNSEPAGGEPGGG